MLLKLSVKNFTLIRDLQIDFSSSLNIITGQTGSGKSLIISAIHAKERILNALAGR